jgi:hypothetical protein
MGKLKTYSMTTLNEDDGVVRDILSMLFSNGNTEEMILKECETEMRKLSPADRKLDEDRLTRLMKEVRETRKNIN